MNGLSVRFRAREFYKDVSYVFVVAAFVDEGDVWSLSHVALALSALGLLVAICTFAFCVWALRRERVRRRSQVRDAVWEWAGGMANKDEVEKLKEAVSDLSERLASLEVESSHFSDEGTRQAFQTLGTGIWRLAERGDPLAANARSLFWLLTTPRSR